MLLLTQLDNIQNFAARSRLPVHSLHLYFALLSLIDYTVRVYSLNHLLNFNILDMVYNIMHI